MLSIAHNLRIQSNLSLLCIEKVIVLGTKLEIFLQAKKNKTTRRNTRHLVIRIKNSRVSTVILRFLSLTLMFIHLSQLNKTRTLSNKNFQSRHISNFYLNGTRRLIANQKLKKPGRICQGIELKTRLRLEKNNQKCKKTSRLKLVIKRWIKRFSRLIFQFSQSM